MCGRELKVCLSSNFDANAERKERKGIRRIRKKNKKNLKPEETRLIKKM